MVGGKRMDTFIDKLAQKRNAQEMIRANMTAETAKMEQMQEQMKAYDELLQEIRKVNLKTAENAAEVQNVLKACMEQVEAMGAGVKEENACDKAEEALKISEDTLKEIKALLEQQFTQTNDFLHKENVKVYRNVQAAMAEELGKQTEELKASQVQNRGSRALLPVSVLILIGVLADIAIQLFSLLMIPMP